MIMLKKRNNNFR